MKMNYRERVDGTQITIGKRVYYQNKKRVVANSYSAEYTDYQGKQRCIGLKTKNIVHARRRAIKIQEQMEKGIEYAGPPKMTVKEMTDNYFEMIRVKGAAPKTKVKYRTDLDKLNDFCTTYTIRQAAKFSPNDLYRYRRYLIEEKKYAAKTVQGAIVLAKQVFKWAWRQGLLQRYDLEAVTFPKAKAGPQPCFTTAQVDLLIEAAQAEEKLAFALMGYAGLRIGEVEQLHRQDIISTNSQFSMIHIHRGGSNGTTKDKDDRFVPVHPQIAKLLTPYQKRRGILLPAINERNLLKRLKILCAECRFDNPTQYKLHSFRHHFASMCANHGVAHRKTLTWLGHSSSEMLELYYHLHDEDSHNTMMELARSYHPKTLIVPTQNKGNFRATARSKIVNNTQPVELQGLMDFLLREKQKPERAGFSAPCGFTYIKDILN